ncbi:MAG: FAD-binding oxidoreductase [Candidatus Hermodarchaeota archaeon]
MNKESILRDLEDIVGKDFVTNKPEDLFIYSQDPGASEPRPVDFVVMPKKVEEVQKIVKLANKEKIPLIPMGGGLTLSGLILPVHKGIVMDMKRMDRILEINSLGRYAVLEAGVTTGSIVSYLNENHPKLQAPIPDSPTSATVAGNVLIHGSGSLSQKYGHHASMINGLEVVLPTGEITKLGSCAISEYWFSKAPIPDLIGLFTSSFGTMGVITKVSIKLYPKPKERDMIFGLIMDFDGIPNLMSEITYTEFAEDVMVAHTHTPSNMKQFCSVMVYITANSTEEMSLKKSTIEKIFKENKVQATPMPPQTRTYMMEHPQYTAAFAADWRKGGGFEYVGSFIPLEKIPEAIEKGVIISEKYGLVPSLLFRIIGSGHAVMFSVTFPFNRADPDDRKNAREGLEETNKMVLEIGGVPWKTELAGQRLTMEKADPHYKVLFKRVRNLLDPNGIMNPGNWEV